MSRNKIAILVILVFLVGMAVIIYRGRPAWQMENEAPGGPVAPVILGEERGEIPSGDPGPSGVYTMAEVESHDVAEDCWTAINGSVYDLTTWASRHPGGASPILSLCGRDGSVDFNRQHGRSNTAQSALILLKIGELN